MLDVEILEKTVPFMVQIGLNVKFEPSPTTRTALPERPKRFLKGTTGDINWGKKRVKKIKCMLKKG